MKPESVTLSPNALEAFKTIQGDGFLDVHDLNLDRLNNRLIDMAVDISSANGEEISAFMAEIHSVMVMRKLIKQFNS